MRIAIIGAGIFGLSAAAKLSKLKKIKVDVFDQSNKILDGATFANHNRHHYGFHYPRSQKTIDEINLSKKEFEYHYKDACNFNFKNFYAISKSSRINKIYYENFLERNKLKFKIVKNYKSIFNPRKISSVYEVYEGVYNYNKFVKITEKRVKNVNINLNHKLVNFIKKKKIFNLEFLKNNTIIQKSYDFIINATYSNINEILKILKINTKFYEYNLQQLSIISFKNKRKLGATIMDGNYPSFLPIGNSNKHLFAHVTKSQLVKKKSKNNIFNQINYINDNYFNINKESKKYLPILKNSIYHGSIYVNRVVVKNNNDDRLSDLIFHKKNFISILGGKIITCEKTSNDIVSYFKKNL